MTMPDLRVLELAEKRASYDAYDVAALAQEVLLWRALPRDQPPCDYCGWPVGRSRSCGQHNGLPLKGE